jgi:hypothetical protein
MVQGKPMLVFRKEALQFQRLPGGCPIPLSRPRFPQMHRRGDFIDGQPCASEHLHLELEDITE